MPAMPGKPFIPDPNLSNIPPLFWWKWIGLT